MAIEQELMVPLYNSQGEFLEKPLLAVLDLMTRENDGLLVTDFKTSSRRYVEADAATSMQVTCYVHAVQERYDEVPDFRYTVLVKTKTPQLQELATDRDQADIGRMGDLFQVVEQAIASKLFYPIESPLNCSGCSFRSACRDWRGIETNESQRTNVEAARELVHVD